jgi:putative addiction module component (TIGR02574 family)
MGMTTADVHQLSRAEKILLVQQLWDEIAAEPDELPLAGWQEKALEEGLAAHESNPQAISSWDEVKARLLSRL